MTTISVCLLLLASYVVGGRAQENDNEKVREKGKEGLGVVAVGTGAALVVKAGAGAAVPSLMSTLAVSVPGVGAMHGPAIGVVQAFAAAGLGSVAAAGVLTVGGGYVACQFTSYADKCNGIAGGAGGMMIEGVSSMKSAGEEAWGWMQSVYEK
jgi:hypothetical protein